MKFAWILAFLLTPEALAAPILHKDLLAERYTDIPVHIGEWSYTDPTFPYDRTIRFIEMPRPVLGEVWDISAEVHATNDDLRARGYGLYLTTEIAIGPSSGNTRFVLINDVYQPQLRVVMPNGSYNIGSEAHHGLIARRGIIEWTQDKLDYIATYETLFVKFMVWSGSTQALPGDRCEVTPQKGYLTVLRHLP